MVDAQADDAREIHLRELMNTCYAGHEVSISLIQHHAADFRAFVVEPRHPASPRDGPLLPVGPDSELRCRAQATLIILVVAQKPAMAALMLDEGSHSHCNRVA